MIGRTLAHYEITSLLGKGGMGEVYRAKDLKLGRDVAIKMLPEEFARDPERVARFEREAKLLASLNHPNIAAIHGLEEAGGTHFLVMELVEGETLADQIEKGPIPVEESLKLALQIAEALEAAHERGIVHRDLKPANIKVTPDGRVKVLDFGLAKAFAAEQTDRNLSNSPTLSNAATQQGVILGTAAYMSPEQAKGKAVDRRADIWAFGIVLYEMLAGQPVFREEDVAETLASVVKASINLDLLPANIHPRVREVIIRCLQKEQKNRYRDIGDARYEIERVLTDPSGVIVQSIPATESRRKLPSLFACAAAALFLGLIIAGVAVWHLKPIPPPEPKQVMRFEYELPEGRQIRTVNIQAVTVALSPDGNWLAYSTPEGLYLRSMGDWAAELLVGTEGALYPFFSPDNQWIGYVSGGMLRKIAIGGGAPVALCDAAVDGGFSWTSDNRILHGSGGSIQWVSADDGGKLEPLFEGMESDIGAPQMLPDGESILFTTGATLPHKIMVRSRKSGESKVLFEGGFARYINTGHILYGVGNNLYARRFDPNTLEVAGGPIPLVVNVFNGAWVWEYAVSDSGTLVYIPGASASVGKRILVWVDREGKEAPIAVAPDNYRTLKISPDGKQIAVSIFTGANENIHVLDVGRPNMRSLTFNTLNDTYPLWTPDGKKIVFTSARNEGVSICRKSADGTGETESLSSLLSYPIVPCSWSKDGKILALMAVGYDIEMLYMEGHRGLSPLLHERYPVYNPQIHPDGKLMAYTSDESGQTELWVCPFPEVKKARWKVSTNGGRGPRWSIDGRELFYWADNALMVVSVETGPTFIHGTPKVQFRKTPAQTDVLGTQVISWDIHPDGERFLMLKPAEATDADSSAEPPHKINIVVNWFEELKRRAAGK